MRNLRLFTQMRNFSNISHNICAFEYKLLILQSKITYMYLYYGKTKNQGGG